MLTMLTKPVYFAPPTRYVPIGANILTLNSLHSELLNGASLETCEPRSYFTNSNLVWLGVIACYKLGDV